MKGDNIYVFPLGDQQWESQQTIKIKIKMVEYVDMPNYKILLLLYISLYNQNLHDITDMEKIR